MSNHTQCQNKPRSMFLRSATGLFVYHYMSDVIDTHVNSVPSGGCVYQPIIDLRVDTGNAMTPDYGHAVVIRLSVIGHSGGAVVCLYGYHLSIDLATDSATSGSSAGTLRSMSGVGTSCVSSSSSFLLSPLCRVPHLPRPHGGLLNPSISQSYLSPSRTLHKRLRWPNFTIYTTQSSNSSGCSVPA